MGGEGAGGGFDGWTGAVYTEGMVTTTLTRKHPMIFVAPMLETGVRVIEKGAAHVDGDCTAYRG